MREYIYQLSLRKADDEMKKFRIESDTIITKEIITEEAVKEISNNNQCDVMVQFIGILNSKKVKDIPMEAIHYSHDDIETKLKEWKEESEKHERESLQPVQQAEA